VAYDLAGLEPPNVVVGERRPIGSVSGKGNDAHGPFPCPDPAGGQVDQLAHPHLALARPHRLDHADPREAVAPGPVRVGFEQHDLVGDLDLRVGRHDGDDPEHERDAELGRELHLSPPL